jgi:acetolactate synthase-1/3 small subunit
MTLVVDAEDVEQVVKQLYRLIEVLKVTDVTNQPTVERETTLVKVHAPATSRAPILAVVEAFDARTADVGTTTMIIEMTGTPAKVDNFLAVLRPFGIKEMMRGGTIAMTRGMQRHQTRRTRGAAAPAGYSYAGGYDNGGGSDDGASGNGYAADATGNGSSRSRFMPASDLHWPDASSHSCASTSTAASTPSTAPAPTPTPTDPPTAQADGVA